MPLEKSVELTSIGHQGVFDDVSEIVRVFKVSDGDAQINIRVTVVRHYVERGVFHSLEYELCDDLGVWSRCEYGQIQSGDESEEIAIRTAISSICSRHGLG